jgi:hypothetical protein
VRVEEVQVGVKRRQHLMSGSSLLEQPLILPGMLVMQAASAALMSLLPRTMLATCPSSTQNLKKRRQRRC